MKGVSPIKTFNELTTQELYQIMKLRNEVFVVEQACVYQDCDGKDLDAWHLFHKEDGQIVSYLRILPKGLSYEEVSIGRVVTEPGFRGRGLSRAMMAEAIRFVIHELHEPVIRISAQAYLQQFYKSLGFEAVSDIYLEDDIPHLEMVYENNALGLLIIDVQKAMFDCDGGVYQGEEVLLNIKALISQARDSGVPVIFVQHTEEGSEYDPKEATWAIHEAIAPKGNEPVVEKHYADAFYQTELEEVLKRLGLRQLIVAGMQTEYCMDTSIRNAFSRGYKLYGIAGGHTTFDTQQLKAAEIIRHHESIWNGRFLRLISLEEGLEKLRQERG